MLHPLTNIRWIDTNNERSTSNSVKVLFQVYAHKARELKEGYHRIEFNDDSMKITDWYGWSTIKAINRIRPERQIDWFGVISANQGIVISRETIIPIYDETKPMRGFHGEIKYPYILKDVNSINPCDKVRIKNGMIGDEMIEFSNTIIKYCGDVIFDYGYEIETQSGFFNANNIHMYGSNETRENLILNNMKVIMI